MHFAAETPPVQQPVQQPIQQPIQPPIQRPSYQPPQIPIHEQMRMERRRAHLDKIKRLSMFIA